MGALLQGRYLHATVTLDQHVFVIGGGISPTTASMTTDLLPAGNMTWQQGPLLPVHMKVGTCALAISATSFLVFHVNEIREFDASIAGPTSSQGWAEEDKWPKLERSRFGPGCAKVGEDKVVIAGGYDHPTTHRSTEILDLTSRTISKGGKMATPRFYFHIVTFNNNDNFTTLALGGYNYNDNELNRVEEWRPETESWSKVETKLKVKRRSFGLVAAPKSLICPSH